MWAGVQLVEVLVLSPGCGLTWSVQEGFPQLGDIAFRGFGALRTDVGVESDLG